MQADATSLAPPERAFYVPALDGLRVVAFLMVFFHHRVPSEIPVQGWVTVEVSQWYNGIWRVLAHGVPLFFVLSAYLITTLLLLEKERTGTIRVGEFYIRRILRIWPLYFTILTLATLLNRFVRGPHFGAGDLIKFATLTGNFGAAAGEVYPLSVVILWSVCVEEQFYLTWPWVVKLLTRRALIGCAMALIALGTFSRIYFAISHQHWQVFWFASQCQLDCFGFGILASLCVKNLHLGTRDRRIGYLLSFGGIILLVRYFPTVATDHVGISNAIAYTLVAALAGVVVMITAGRGASRAGLLGSTIFANTGKITYGLYCYHALVILLIAKLQISNIAATLALRLLTTTLIAFLSYRFLETPFLRMREKFQSVRSGALG